jgi:hypothetical protein
MAAKSYVELQFGDLDSKHSVTIDFREAEPELNSQHSFFF